MNRYSKPTLLLLTFFFLEKMNNGLKMTPMAEDGDENTQRTEIYNRTRRRMSNEDSNEKRKMRNVSFWNREDCSSPVAMMIGRRFSVSSESYDVLLKARNYTDNAGVKGDHKMDRSSEQIVIDGLKNNSFTRHHSESFHDLVQGFTKRDTEPGEIVMKEGEEYGNEFYIVERGSRSSFGEQALMMNVTRKETVTSITEGTLRVILRETYRRIIMKSVLNRRQHDLTFLSAVPLLHNLTKLQLEQIADAVKHEVYSQNTVITRQGDTTANKFCIIEGGRVSVSRTNHDQIEIFVAELGPGDYFGEVAFLTSRPRQVTVTAVCSTLFQLQASIVRFLHRFF